MKYSRCAAKQGRPDTHCFIVIVGEQHQVKTRDERFFFSLLCTSQSSQVQVELTFLWIHHVCTSGVWKITQITSEGAIFRGRNADKNDAGVRYLRDLSSTATSRQTVTKFTMLYNNSIYVLVFSVNSTLGIKFIWETSDKHESRHTVLKNKKKKVFFFRRETLPRPSSTHVFVST